ncbi:MAG: hypothetical protein WB460_20025 [Candidatus Acidiferrales bacterium]
MLRIFGTEIHELREQAEQDERSRRLAELDEEIAATRRKLARSIREQSTIGESFEAEWLRGEQERLETALGNLEREHAELMRQ